MQPIGEHEDIAHEPDRGRIARTVGYFLGMVPEKKKLTHEKKGGVIEARWFSEDEMKDVTTYNDLVPIIESGISEAKKIK